MKHIAIAMAALLLAAGAASAELCKKCKDGMYIMSVGKCVNCGGFAGSAAFKLCKACSTKLGQCEHCRGPLKAAPEPDKPKPHKAKPAPDQPAAGSKEALARQLDGERARFRKAIPDSMEVNRAEVFVNERPGLLFHAMPQGRELHPSVSLFLWPRAHGQPCSYEKGPREQASHTFVKIGQSKEFVVFYSGPDGALKQAMMKAFCTAGPKQPADLKVFLPLAKGAAYSYRHWGDPGVDPKRARSVWTCEQTAETPDGRLALFSVRFEGGESLRVGLAVTGQRVWVLERDKAAKPAEEMKALQALAPELAKIEDPNRAGPISKIIWVLDATKPSGPYKDLPEGAFATVPTKEGMSLSHPRRAPGLGPARVRSPRPRRTGRAVPRRGRGGRAVLQRGIGLIRVHTRDWTRHGHAAGMDLVGHRPPPEKAKDWPVPVDVSKPGRHTHGKWMYVIQGGTPPDPKSVSRDADLFYDGKAFRAGAGDSFDPVLTPWGFMRDERLINPPMGEFPGSTEIKEKVGPEK